MPSNTPLTLEDMALLGLLIGLILVLLWRTKFILLSKRRTFMAIGLAMLITLGSLLVSSSGYSGTGTATKFGWPHYYYETWQAFEWEGDVSSSNIHLPYLLANMVLLTGTGLIVTGVRLPRRSRIKKIHP